MLYQRHKRIFPYGYPCAYVPNIHHQFIMILQNAKGKKPPKEKAGGDDAKPKRGRKAKAEQ